MRNLIYFNKLIQHRYFGLAITCGLGLALMLPVATSAATANQDRAAKPWVAPRRHARKKNPLTPDTKSIRIGHDIYLRECVSCHGDNGRGQGPKSAELDVQPGDLTSTKIQDQTDGALYWKITKGRAPMASFKTLLTDEQRWHVINYLRTFGSKSDGVEITPPLFDAPESCRKMLSTLVKPYLNIHHALVKGDLASAKTSSKVLTDASAKLQENMKELLSKEAATHWRDDMKSISAQLKLMNSSEDIKTFRKSFAGVSASFAKMIGHFGHAQTQPLRLFVSKIQYDKKPASWLQVEQRATNPYVGADDRSQATLKLTLGGLHLAKRKGDSK